MSTTAAIRGKMGEYEYFQTTMKSKDKMISYKRVELLKT